MRAMSRRSGRARTRSAACSIAAATAVFGAGSLRSGAAEAEILRTVLGPMPADGRHLTVTADLSHIALLTNAGSRHVVNVDGRAGAAYATVQQAGATVEGRPAPPMLMISPDGTRVAYQASKDGTSWMMVENQKEGQAFDRIICALYSPVGHRLAYVGIKGGMSHVVVDGVVGPGFANILSNELVFSADGEHVGYCGQRQEDRYVWYAVIDGVEQPGQPQAYDVQFSERGGHWAYIARTGDREEFSVVVDGNMGPTYAGIQAVSLSADGTRAGYVAMKPRSTSTAFGKNDYVAVIDGAEGPVFEGISEMVFSPDGRHSAYTGMALAGGRQSAFAVVDGQRSMNYIGASGYTYSADSAHLAYIATNNDKSVVVLDGQESSAYQAIDANSLRFSADGQHLGYVARDSGRAVLVVDGKAGPERQSIDSTSFGFIGTGDHTKFKAGTATGWAVVLDNAPTPAPGEPCATEMVMSGDGKHRAVVMTTGDGTSHAASRVMVDGQAVGPECGTVTLVRMSEDGAHVAWVGAVREEGPGSKEGVHVIHDGEAGPGFIRIDALAMSPDGRHVAYAATDGEGRQHVGIDGFRGPTYDDVPYAVATCANTIQFDRDGSLRFLAVQEKNLCKMVVSKEVLDGLPKRVDTKAPSAAGYAGLYTFGQAKDDGAKPCALAAGSDGTLYGATSSGGEFKKGVIFSMKPDGSGYRIVRPIEGGQGDGSYPSSMWVGADGAIYGSMQGEGPNGHGVVFRCSVDGSSYSILRGFTGNDREDGESPMIYAMDEDGTMYGISSRNRVPRHLFRMKADGSDFKLIYSPNPTSGSADDGVGPFVDGGDGYFYGVAGLNIYKIKKDGTGYAVVRKFQGPPRDISLADRAPILGGDGLLYGFASSGGKSTGGVVYKIARDGSGYKMILDPAEVLGPRALVYGPDDQLYMLAEKGVCRVDRDGNNFEVLHEMAGGYFPWTVLVREGVLYGMTAQGNTGGQVFKYGIGGTGAVSPASVEPTFVYRDVPIAGMGM